MKALRIVGILTLMALCWACTSASAQLFTARVAKYLSPEVNGLNQALRDSLQNNNPTDFVNAFNSADPKTQAKLIGLYHEISAIASEIGETPTGGNPFDIGKFTQALQDCSIGDCSGLTAILTPQAVDNSTPSTADAINATPTPGTPGLVSSNLVDPGSNTANSVNAGPVSALPTDSSSGGNGGYGGNGNGSNGNGSNGNGGNGNGGNGYGGNGAAPATPPSPLMGIGELLKKIEQANGTRPNGYVKDPFGKTTKQPTNSPSPGSKSAMAPTGTGSSSGGGCACDKAMPGTTTANTGQLKLRPSTANGHTGTNNNGNTATTSKAGTTPANNTASGSAHLQLRSTTSLTHVASANPGPTSNQPGLGHTTNNGQSPNTANGSGTGQHQPTATTQSHATNTGGNTTYKTTHPLSNAGTFRTASLPNGQAANPGRPQPTVHRFGASPHTTGSQSHSSHTTRSRTRVSHTSYRPARTANRGNASRGNAVRGGAFRGGGTRVARRSDIRLKQDIVRIGQLDNGIGIYRFRYLGSDRTIYVGVLAQEVQNVTPGAVVRGRDGYLRVYYDKLGLQFMTFNQWRERRQSHAAP